MHVPSITIPLATMAFLATLPGLAIVNDDCSSAVPLTAGVGCTFTSGSWTDATQSMVPIPCGGATNISANDAWFSFSAVGEHTIIVVQSDPSNDAVVEVFSGDCANLVSIACSDATLAGGAESLTINSDAGTTYFVRTYWWDYGSVPASLEFGICITQGPPSPPNDDCSSVSPVVIPAGSSHTFTGTTVGADSLGDHVPGSTLATGTASVWHAFTTEECANVRVSYCGTLPPFANTWTVLAHTCPADTVVFADAFDLSSCGNGNISMWFDSLVAGTWYLPVLSDDPEAYGPYEVEVIVNGCATGSDEREGYREWGAYFNDDHLVILPATNERAVVELLGADGRLHQTFTCSCAPGIPVLLPVVSGQPAVCLVRISTAGGRKTLRLLRTAH